MILVWYLKLKKLNRNLSIIKIWEPENEKF